MKSSLKTTFLLAGLAAASSAFAGPILPVAYDMPNGNGQASGGSYNYWDKNYTGIGNTSLDGAFLSGGLGDLTDGVIATQNWYLTENGGGTGPYVGWLNVNPTIKFRFVGSPSISSITLYLDDSNGAGGVNPPALINLSVDGGPALSYAVTDPASAAPFSVTLPIGQTVNNYIDVTLNRSYPWTFMSEVQFDGASSQVPDGGATAALMAGGMALLAWARRREQN